MIERGCGLHWLKDKDDLEESTLSGLVFPPSHKIESCIRKRRLKIKSSDSGLCFLRVKGARTFDSDPRNRVQETHSDLGIRERNHKSECICLDPSIGVQKLGSWGLGSRIWGTGGLLGRNFGTTDRDLSQLWLSLFPGSGNKEVICHVCLHLHVLNQ